MNGLERTRLWVDFAVRDYQSALFLTNMHPRPVEIICFHCQQAAEKMLKGIMVRNDIDPPKMHNLPELFQQCKGLTPLPEELEIGCDRLNAYGVQPRYPANVMVEEADMKCALKDCSRLMHSIIPQLIPELAMQYENELETIERSGFFVEDTPLRLQGECQEDELEQF